MGLILLIIAGVLLGALVGFIIGLIINLIRLAFLCLWWIAAWAANLGWRTERQEAVEFHIVIRVIDDEEEDRLMKDVTPIRRRLGRDHFPS
jgi:hypothetical protein